MIIEDFAELLGLTLIVYDKDEGLLGATHTNAICSTIQANGEGLRLCEQDCGSMLSQVAAGGEFATFRCHAQLYNFAAPIKLEGKIRYLLLGGRVFRNYQDFAEFNKKAASYGVKDVLFMDWEHSNNFEDDGLRFERAVSFIQSLVDTATESPEIDLVKKKSYQTETLYELCAILGREESHENIFQLALQALGVLFDVSAAAILQRRPGATAFEALNVVGSVIQPLFQLNAGDSAFDNLERQYLYFEEIYPILRMGFPESVRSVHTFLITSCNGTEWILQIYNRALNADSVQILKTFCQHIALSLARLLLRKQVSAHGNTLNMVADFNMAVNSQLECPDVCRTILLKSIEVIKAEQGSLLVFDEGARELSVRSIKGLNEKLVEKLRIQPGQGVAGSVFETGQSLLIKNIDDEPRFKPHQRTRYRTKSFLSVPLRINDRKIGVLNIADKISGDPFDEDDLRLLETISSQACVALERSDFYQKSEDLRRISITDSLTDLYNRRFFHDRLTEELERARRHSQSLSLIMLDIDNFKTYNDTHGYRAGDEALRITSASLKNSVRNIDMVARFGGEEFAVILPMTEAKAANDIAERIRGSVSSRFFPDHSLKLEEKLTVSLGIACFPRDCDSVLELIGNADKALYLAKVAGKNRVSIFDRAQQLKNASGL